MGWDLNWHLELICWVDPTTCTCACERVKDAGKAQQWLCCCEGQSQHHWAARCLPSFSEEDLVFWSAHSHVCVWCERPSECVSEKFVRRCLNLQMSLRGWTVRRWPQQNYLCSVSGHFQLPKYAWASAVLMSSETGTASDRLCAGEDRQRLDNFYCLDEWNNDSAFDLTRASLQSTPSEAKGVTARKIWGWIIEQRFSLNFWAHSQRSSTCWTWQKVSLVLSHGLHLHNNVTGSCRSS